MKAVLLLLLLIVGIAGGGALGLYLKPPDAAEDTDAAGKDTDASPDASDGAALDPELADAPAEYITFGRKFVVPVVEGTRTRALVVVDIGIDAPEGAGDAVQAAKPRLRDAFLRVLFAMAATGAFDQTYTEAPVMEELRRKLLAAARQHSGSGVREVLILDLIRKEL